MKSKMLQPIHDTYKIDPDTLEAISAVTEQTRIKILLFLGQQGRVCVNDIADNFSLSRPAISHHLKVLKNYGLVKSEKQGQEIFYSPNLGHLAPKLRELADVLEGCCP